MSRVLIIGTSRFTRGGISAVIKAQQQGEQWERYHCKWLGYHIDRAFWIKLLYYAIACIRYMFLLPFYDIIHYQFSLQDDARRSYLLFRVAKFLKKKTIIHLHCGDQLPEIWSPLYEQLFTRCDLALVLSPSIKRKIEEYIGSSSRIAVLYNPCPAISTITPFESREKKILFAGTLNSNKGYQDLIKGFALIGKNYPDWRVVFAGNGEIDEAKDLAKSLGISDQCDFLGWVNGEQKDACFRSASVLCLPSYKEGFPMAVLDAWAYGVPVVTTPAGGLVDIIEKGKNGLLFAAGNIEAMAEELDKIISDDLLREAIGEESRVLAKTVFNLDNLNKQLGDYYESLL